MSKVDGYWGFGDLGEQLGPIPGVRVGKLLDRAGLRDGRAPTARAVELGACSSPLHGKNNGPENPYFHWRPQVVLPILREMLASAAVETERTLTPERRTELLRKSGYVWKVQAPDGRILDPSRLDAELLALAHESSS